MTTTIRSLYLKAAAGLLVLLLLASCTSVEKKYVIPERKFAGVLVDMHLADAIGAQSKKDLNFMFQVDSASLYGAVFRKHNITQAMFDSSLFYYSLRPERFEKIYNLVTAELKHREEDLSKEQQKEELAESEILWKSDVVYVFPKMGSNKIYIDVPVSKPGIYIVSATVKMLPDDASLDPRMSVYFSDSTAEGKRMPFSDARYTTRTGEERTYKCTRRLTIKGEYSFIRGYIANYSNADSTFRRNMVVKDIMVLRRDIKDERPELRRD